MFIRDIWDVFELCASHIQPPPPRKCNFLLSNRWISPSSCLSHILKVSVMLHEMNEVHSMTYPLHTVWLLACVGSEKFYILWNCSLKCSAAGSWGTQSCQNKIAKIYTGAQKQVINTSTAIVLQNVTTATLFLLKVRDVWLYWMKCQFQYLIFKCTLSYSISCKKG